MRGDLIAVYIMANRRNGTLYIGSTTDLIARVHQHRTGSVRGFTQRYGCKLLAWYEVHDELEQARLTELRMKKWNRGWKLRAVERMNPGWADLFPSLLGADWTPAFAGVQESDGGHDRDETSISSSPPLGTPL